MLSTEDTTIASFLNMAYYFINDGRLYCNKNSSRTVVDKSCFESDSADKQTIMRLRQRNVNITVESNKIGVLTLKAATQNTNIFSQEEEDGASPGQRDRQTEEQQAGQEAEEDEEGAVSL